jgi:hypothetical protein
MEMLCRITAAIFLAGIFIVTIAVGVARMFPGLSVGCV